MCSWLTKSTNAWTRVVVVPGLNDREVADAASNAEEQDRVQQIQFVRAVIGVEVGAYDANGGRGQGLAFLGAAAD
jgi:hypothetical protein